MSKQMPLNFMGWIESHRHLLVPPVGNAQVYADAEFIVMVVGGPNSRKDYHIDPGEEFFYQLEGEMVLKLVEDGEFRDVPIKAGEIFLLPANVPHSPQRMAGGVGLVMERRRREGELDGLRWYCEGCHEVLYEEFFHLTDITKELAPVMAKFMASEELRTCRGCGEVMSPPGK